MWYLFSRTLLTAICGFLAGCAFFAGFLYGRGEVIGDGWLSLVAVGGACAVIAAFAVFCFCMSQQRAMRAVGERLDDFQADILQSAPMAMRHLSRLPISPDLSNSLANLAERYVSITARLAEEALKDEPSDTENKLRKQTEELFQANRRLRQINQELERLKESYRDLYHNAPVMYFSLDPTGHIVTLNETLLHSLGYQRRELLNKSYMDLEPSDLNSSWEFDLSERERKELPLSQTLTREGEVQTKWKKKDGTVIDVLIRTVPVTDEKGRFVRSRSAAQDMTERHRLAEQLRGRGDELERANAELRRINVDLEEFTSVVSHDLKEPLRTLQAYTNLLMEDFSQALGIDGFEYINNVVLASRRMERLIEDLLHLSWAGRMISEMETFNLTQAIANVRRDLGDLIQRKNAEIQIDGSLPTINGDLVRISQLLSNLVGNALKYNKSAKPAVHVGTAGDRQPPVGKPVPDDHVLIYIHDNGIGIEPADQLKIFGMFRRLQNSSEFEGTGAGLAICKKIVETHNGIIWVESTKGVGSTFYVSLPQVKAESNGRAKPASDLPSPKQKKEKQTSRRRSTTPKPTVVGSRQLLIVEDMAEIGAIAKRLGERAGHTVTWAPTAEKALELLQKSTPDLILLDVNLPGMSGFDFCKKIRSDPKFKELPIALFTQDARLEQDFRPYSILKVLPKSLLSQPDVWQSQLNELLQQTAPY